VAGHLINLQMLQELQEMGFEEQLVIEGLRQTDNNQQQTLNLLTQNKDLLRSSLNKPPTYATNDKLQQIISMGYSHEEATKALDISFGDVSSAVDKLLSSDPSLFSSLSSSTSDSLDHSKKDEAKDEAKDEMMMDAEAIQRKEKEKLEREELEKQLLDDVPEDEDEFLDISLDQEEAILNEYLLKVHQSN